MQKLKLLKVDLRLFDEGAGAPADGGDATQTTTQTTETNKNIFGGSHRAKKAETKVLYGIQEDAQESQQEQNPVAGDKGAQQVPKSLEERKKAFEEMIASDDYKDIYSEKFQEAFNRRFKNVKGMEATLESHGPILDMLFERYKIEDGDLGKLQTAIEEDDVYLREEAENEGMTVEQLKAMKKLSRENAEFRKAEQRLQGEQQARATLNQWYADGNKLKEIYPTFDFRIEAQDRDFLGLLRSGLSVQQAYEVRHMDEIKEMTAKAAAQTAGEQMKARIQSRSERPKENGTSSQAAVIVKSDVHSLTRADRKDIVRRALKGEKIKF